MNNSPTQLPTQINNQPTQLNKPKIAFTYQHNLPRGSMENQCPMSPSLVTKKLELQYNISPTSFTNPDRAPLKLGDK